MANCSVVIPYYQKEPGILLRALKSVFAQSHRDFHIIVVDNISRLKILLLFVTVFWGGHTKMKEVKVFAGKQIHIHTSSLLPLHADGENIGFGSVSVCVQENALSVIRAKAN